MDILEQIIQYKKKEVAERKTSVSVNVLERSVQGQSAVSSMKKALLNSNKTGIIAEFKRRSPSKGVINSDADVETTTKGYASAGASALSILTDNKFFGGSNEDLIAARRLNSIPILRKDFMIDEYQIIEARSIGADAVLLIAAALDVKTSRILCEFAHSLGLEVLLEVHNEEELKNHIEINPDLIGVNNRNLKTFEVSIDTSRELSQLIPDSFVKVSESGISDPTTMIELRTFGYRGFLMGENFMKEKRPDIAAMEFMNNLTRLESQTHQTRK